MDLAQPEIDGNTKQERCGDRNSVGTSQPADLRAADKSNESGCSRSDSTNAGGTMRKNGLRGQPAQQLLGIFKCRIRRGNQHGHCGAENKNSQQTSCPRGYGKKL